MEDKDDGDGYFFICDKTGKLIDIKNCFHCEKKRGDANVQN